MTRNLSLTILRSVPPKQLPWPSVSGFQRDVKVITCVLVSASVMLYVKTLHEVGLVSAGAFLANRSCKRPSALRRGIGASRVNLLVVLNYYAAASQLHPGSLHGLPLLGERLSSHPCTTFQTRPVIPPVTEHDGLLLRLFHCHHHTPG